MKKLKYPTDQTKCIDYCICPYCGFQFDGDEALNYEIISGSKEIKCINCNGLMRVYLSIEYLCVADS